MGGHAYFDFDFGKQTYMILERFLTAYILFFLAVEVFEPLSVNIPHSVPVPDARGADLLEWVHLVSGLSSLGKIHLHCLSIQQVRNHSKIT